MICITYRARTNIDWCIKYEYKKPFKMKKLFASFSYYKLKARKHFIHYVFGLRSKGYGVGGVEEILDQVLMILRVFSGWKTIGKKSKLMARASLRNSQCHGSTMTNTMKSNLSDTVWDVVQANHQDDASSIDESRHVLHSQSEAF